MDEFEEELRINPNGFGAYNGLKVTLFDKQLIDEVIKGTEKR